MDSSSSQYFAFAPSGSTTAASSNPQSASTSLSSLSAAAVNDRPVPGTNDAAPFLADFSLLAEAAKRAQMACLTRDLDSMGF